MLVKLFTTCQRYLTGRIRSRAKSSFFAKPKTKSLLLCCISLSALQLSAAETAVPSVQQSANATVNVKNDLLPKLVNYLPMPCVSSGSEFTIRGMNFDQLNSTQRGLSLVIELDGKQLPIKYQQKSDTLIMTTLPSQLNNVTSVRVGLSPDKKWRQNSLDIKICSTNKPDLDEPAPDRPDPNIPDPSLPDPDKSETDRLEPELTAANANTDLKRRIANRQTEGSLLGKAVPDLPQELNLKQSTNSSSYVSDELIAISADIDQAKQLAQIMGGYQARTIRRKTLGALGMVLTTFRLAPGYKVSEVLAQLSNNNPEILIDANHFYYPNAKSSTKNVNSNNNNNSNNSRANLFTTIGLTNNHQCSNKVKLGILDGPVDQAVDSLVNQSIIQKQMFSRGKQPASASHGTAIASLLVGSSEFAELSGVINHAELAVGVVMQAQPDDKSKVFSSTESLILGLNWLVEQKVSVINLSLGGPKNAMLEIALNKVLELDIGVVAAAGNGGNDQQKIYPAAQPGVIAVSALDSDANLAEDATQGDYIELSAPGVDLWVAAEKAGAHYLSGSSLAAPLVAAALAQLGGSPKQSTLLFKTSKDLGKPGKDAKFGWGMLQFPTCESKP